MFRSGTITDSRGAAKARVRHQSAALGEADSTEKWLGALKVVPQALRHPSVDVIGHPLIMAVLVARRAK